jgi:hypothetical protein
MEKYSRRNFITNVGLLSAGLGGAVGLGSSFGLEAKTAKKRSNLLGTGHLCVIFPGAWLFDFGVDAQNQPGIRAITPKCLDHVYEFGISPLGSDTPQPIEPASYHVNVVTGANPPNTTPSGLVSQMAKDGHGFVFRKGVGIVNPLPADARTVFLPIPDAIEEVALAGSIGMTFDPSLVITKLTGNQIPYLPAAYIFRYKSWKTATVTKDGNSKVLATADPTGADKRTHLVFRVRRPASINPSPCDTTTATFDATHAEMAFACMMGLLDVADPQRPTIKVPPGCTSLIEAPTASDVDPEEYGIPQVHGPAVWGQDEKRKVRLFGVELANCGVSGGIAGGAP